jgi:hypothetical protein
MKHQTTSTTSKRVATCLFEANTNAPIAAIFQLLMNRLGNPVLIESGAAGRSS